ncbi:4-hydroxy-3-methylbut-2-enyl diphosphate reductase [Desulfosediminicola flagellatus]|uniref:4-hydroxy-3-methylbut-2-enyl diphosphate reductase n=1 Tax=Desulfosediminicola flagellatus TaxID=2569541 RepID=UPI0010AD8BA9|nr:4-hydroxy-3-methylbut-2-enyl diphosphate reductase [Desulfosediminicola flagellatus]
MSKFDIVLASPRGFCAGVERAIETVKQAIIDHGSPVYVLHEIVHNKHVLQELEKLGAIFVEELQDIPTGEICIFSAHGVSVSVENKAKKLGLRTIDATCPLVGSVHRMVEKYHDENYDVIIIGHHKHPEVEGTAGRVTGKVHIIASEKEAKNLQVDNESRVAYVTQTTLSKDDIVGIHMILKNRFPLLRGPKSNICFATENRQNAVKKLAVDTDLIFVVGSKNSSNSNRLREVSLNVGTQAYLIDDRSDIDESWLEGVGCIGITAGASAPERLVEGVIDCLKEHGAGQVITMEGLQENIHFKAAAIEK